MIQETVSRKCEWIILPLNQGNSSKISFLNCNQAPMTKIKRMLKRYSDQLVTVAHPRDLCSTSVESPCRKTSSRGHLPGMT